VATLFRLETDDAPGAATSGRPFDDARARQMTGRQAAAHLAPVAARRSGVATLRRRTRAVRDAIFRGVTAHPSARLYRTWLAENGRLIAATVKELQQLAEVGATLPLVSCDGELTPRVVALAEAYVTDAEGHIAVEPVTAFLRGVQEVNDLTLDEIWAFRSALQLVLTERLVAAVTSDGDGIPSLLTGLRALGDLRWKEVFADVNAVDRVLAADPARAYQRMDDDSRDQYRRVISELAQRSGLSEREVATEAIALARAATDAPGRAAQRRRHVGYYLVDSGLALLRQQLGCRVPRTTRLADGLRAHATLSYLAAISLVTAAVVSTPAAVFGVTVATAVAALLLLAPAAQAAIDIVNTLVTTLIRPKPLPKLDFDEGVPDDCVTLVAVPALLISEAHVRALVMDMEIRYLANRDRNVLFALVTNSGDSAEQPEEHNPALRLCRSLVHELNARYGAGRQTPFYLLHRFRAYNPSEQRWIGWERKRGKLLDLNQLLRGVRDRFPVKVGNIDALRRARYVIVLDSDTQLPRDAARRLIGTIAHPLNRAVIDPTTRTVVEGYGILQPRISVSTRSAVRSWLANLYSGETGFDIYTRAVSDVYQDLFGEGIFTGKGIYEVDVFREALERRFPANTLLSHDLIEGLFARAGLVTDVELVDDYPSHFSAYCRRRHRWMRGDWQILRWLSNTVPDFHHQAVCNPLRGIARWKILDNLRRTVVELSTLLLLLVAWLAMPNPAAWTLGVVLLWLAPTWVRMLVAWAHAPWFSGAFGRWVRTTMTGFLRAHLVVALQITYLLHDAALSVDAIGRALVRMFVTRRRLLEWETAAEAALRSRGATDVYLEWSPAAAAALGVVVAAVRPDALHAAVPILVPWMVARAVARWLNRPRRAASGDLVDADARLLRSEALRIWRFFATHSTAHNHWLIPDAVYEDGRTADKLSPTNLGLLLNARIVAVQMGYLTVAEFVAETRRTLATMRRLARYRGHFLNWYDTRTLAVLEPRFVSTVDSGNLAAALWAVKQAAIRYAEAAPDPDVLWDGIVDVARALADASDPAGRALSERVMRTRAPWHDSLQELEGLVLHYAGSATGEARMLAAELHARLRHARAGSVATPELSAGLHEIARAADAFVEDMDFAFLYDPRRKVLSVGYDVGTGRLERSTYDLLASESRIASFIAVAKGDIPQESWFHLGRTHTAAQDQRVLVSWTGTLFEYLMPALWFRHRPHTIMHDSMRAAVTVQRRFARAHRIPWGFSESAYVVPGSDDYGYGPCGVPDLALKPLDERTVVVSPYSTFLALLVDPHAAIHNLRRLKRLGCEGRFGLYEAIDYSQGDPQMVRTWMAHHQGMSLLSIADALGGNEMQRAFHAEPQVRATERLLEERVPLTSVPPRTETPRVLWPEESVA
jgi:cyclic beta-1,2-glucan synthetase